MKVTIGNSNCTITKNSSVFIGAVSQTPVPLPSNTAAPSLSPTPTPTESLPPTPTATPAPTQPPPTPSGTNVPPTSTATTTPTPTPTPTPTNGVVPTPTPTGTYGLWAWGYNNGNIGDGTTGNITSPIQITALETNLLPSNIVASWAQKSDGTMWVWGENTAGRLGINTATNVTSPVQLGTGTNEYNSFSLGTVSAATKPDGTLWTWGFGNFGALGQGDTISRSSPAQVGSSTNWAKAFACVGPYAIYALKKDGTLWASGMGTFINNGIPNTSSFVQIGTDNNWEYVQFNYPGSTIGNIIAKKTDGTWWGWGHNTTGLLGLSNTIPYSSPVQIGVGSTWSSMSVGQQLAGIRSDGTLWTCGNNGSGQLAQNSLAPQSSLVQVGSDNTWTKIVTGGSAGTNATLIGRKSDNTLWGAGANNAGQLGQSNAVAYSSLVQIGNGGWAQLSGTNITYFALK